MSWKLVWCNKDPPWGILQKWQVKVHNVIPHQDIETFEVKKNKFGWEILELAVSDILYMNHISL